jgi:hypothetical protein
MDRKLRSATTLSNAVPPIPTTPSELIKQR